MILPWARILEASMPGVHVGVGSDQAHVAEHVGGRCICMGECCDHLPVIKIK